MKTFQEWLSEQNAHQKEFFDGVEEYVELGYNMAIREAMKSLQQGISE